MKGNATCLKGAIGGERYSIQKLMELMVMGGPSGFSNPKIPETPGGW
jgi:hypothetical protein